MFKTPTFQASSTPTTPSISEEQYFSRSFQILDCPVSTPPTVRTTADLQSISGPAFQAVTFQANLKQILQENAVRLCSFHATFQIQGFQAIMKTIMWKRPEEQYFSNTAFMIVPFPENTLTTAQRSTVKQSISTERFPIPISSIQLFWTAYSQSM